MPDATRWSGGDIQQGTCQMPSFSFVLLYVENPPASAAFYADLLGRPPIETSPTFAMLPLSDGVMLGLWSRKTVEPAAIVPAGGRRSRVHGRRCRGSQSNVYRLEQAWIEYHPGTGANGFWLH